MSGTTLENGPPSSSTSSFSTLKQEEVSSNLVSSSPNLVEMTAPTESSDTSRHEAVTNKRASLNRSNTLPKDMSKAESVVVLNRDKLQQFRQWMLCIVVAYFDVDYGPKVESIHPAVELNPQECENIAFSAFPDTSHGATSIHIHSFRIRSDYARRLSIPDDVEETLKYKQDDGFLYGYSAFLQQKDKTSKRGYSQRSIIFLTRHQFPALFSAAIATAIPMFQKHGNEMLETAIHGISSWPALQAGATLELGFLGSILHVEIPKSIDQQQLTETASFGEAFDPHLHILASHPPLEYAAVEIFQAILPSLWSLWECIVLAEPIFLYAPSPAIASAAIWWLRDWVRPLPMAGDFRPYFTIHDPDHKRFMNKNAPVAGIMIGTTNPFLYEECKHWPHIVSLTPSKTTPSPGPTPGFKTTHRRYISKDRVLLKQLETAMHKAATNSTSRTGSSSSHERLSVSNLLRQHFAARARALLVPLNRYLTTLMPIQPSASTLSITGNSSPASTFQANAQRQRARAESTERLAPFSTVDMMASLEKNGSPLPFKSSSRRREFYQRWLRTPAFGAWLVREEEVVNRVLAERREPASSANATSSLTN